MAAVRGFPAALAGLARAERERLPRVAQPPTLDDVLVMERKRIEKQSADATQFTEAERRKLTVFYEQKRSWNPLTRASATKAEAALHEVLRTRRMTALGGALREFEARDVPQIAKRIAGDERRYRDYIAASLLDRHGGRRIRPKAHHAQLAVNAANTLCSFILASHAQQ